MKGLLHGIDVSNWQGSVDWGGHARSGVAFAFAKATEGGDFTDRWFARNWDGMRESWIVCGAYHFARPKGDPGEQARHFLRAVRAAGGLRRGDLIALDLETTDGQRPEGSPASPAAGATSSNGRPGVRPFIYTFHSFARAGQLRGAGALSALDRQPDTPAAAGRRCPGPGRTGRSTSTPTAPWTVTSSTAPGRHLG